MDAGAMVADRYRIQRRIARGGQACVYLAQQLPLDRKVALKVLSSPPTATSAERDLFQQRFLLEARTLAALNHPNIVTVFDYGKSSDGTCFIAMEYIEGAQVNKLTKGPMPPERALRIIRQVVEAMRYAHDHGVIHRDIKNSNVLVAPDGSGGDMVKVVDFGIAKLTNDDATLTVAGTVLGSPHFMPPEQVRGHDIDHRADIYAVGVLFYCALAGKYPFSSSSSHMLLVEHLTRTPPMLHERSPEVQVPPDLEAIVHRCLRKDPDERYASAEDLLAAIDALSVDTLSLAPPHAPILPPLPPSATKPAVRSTLGSWRTFIVAAVLLCGALPLAAGVAAFTYVTLTGPAAEPTVPPAAAATIVEAVPAPEPPAAPAVTPEPTTAPAAVAPRRRVVPARPDPAPEPAPTAAPPPAPEPAAAPTPAPAPAAEEASSGGEDFSIEERDIRNPWGGQ